MIFDHIGIVVRDPEAGRKMLSAAFMIDEWTELFEDPVNDVLVQFGRDPSGICYETVAPLSARSPVRRALADGVNIVNHTAYLVGDLAAERARLRLAGFLPVADARPAIAYGNAPIQFFMSRTRMLFELIEAPAHRHEYRRTKKAGGNEPFPPRLFRRRPNDDGGSGGAGTAPPALPQNQRRPARGARRSATIKPASASATENSDRRAALASPPGLCSAL